MRIAKTHPNDAGTEMIGLNWLSFRMMLVAFIALTCVSCSLFPQKELSGTTEERPKVAQGILTSLNTFNGSLESLYTSVARGLDENVLSQLDQFVVEGSKKSPEGAEQAVIIKAGLDILVDLKASRVASNEFEQALDSLRTTLVLFNLPTLQYLQVVGRYQLPSSLSLSSNLSSGENTLALSLTTIAAIARRAGIETSSDPAPELSAEVTQKVLLWEQRLSKLKPETFLYLLPYLANALKLETPIEESLRTEAQQIFSLAIAENGLLLASALQTQKDGGQIDLNSFKNTLNEWSTDVQKKSIAAATGASIPVLAEIPDKAPTLNEGTGALPDGNDGWAFALVENPTLGSVDLTKNPPEYTPTVTSGFSIDRYGFHACLKIIPTFCTSSFSVVVQTPVKPWTISVKTSQGIPAQFRRGDVLVCSAELQSTSQSPTYRWTLVRTEPTFSADVTQWQTELGQLQVPNAITPGGSDFDIREDDKITCEVAARDPNGLQSPFSSPSLATMTAVNSPASDIYLVQSGAAFDENIKDQLGNPVATLTNELDIKIDDLDLNSFPQNLTIEDCDGPALAECPFEVQPPTDTVPNQTGHYTASIKRKPEGELNFEQKSFYNLLLKIVDSGAQELIKVVRVDVSDRNDAMTEILPREITESENKKLSQILTVTDEDCPEIASCQSEGYTYTLGGADAAYFELNGRVLQSKNNLEFEQFDGAALRSPVYTISVTATDAEGNSHEQVITVNVTNENEQPESIVAGALPLLIENSASNQVWHTLSITDPDHPVTDPADPAYDGSYQDEVTYTLTVTNSAKRLLVMDGRNIKFGPDPINYEEFEIIDENGNSSSSLNIMLTATDPGGLSVVANYTVPISDVNENPTNVYFGGSGNPSSRFVQGSKSDNRTVVSPDATLPLVADDPDGDTGLSFEIVSVNGNPYGGPTANQPFEISGASIRPTRVLDYSVVGDQQWTIEVRAQDPGGLYSQPWSLSIKLVEIRLTNNEISENTLPQTIGDFCVNDPQNGENCSDWVFSFVSVPSINGQQLFNLDGNALKSSAELNFEEYSSHNIIVRAQSTMTAGLFYERVFTINVTNQNEKPESIVFTPSTPAVDPNSTEIYVLAGTAAGTSLGTLYAADEDLAFDINDINSELLSWEKSDDPVTSADHEYFEFEYPTENNLKRETIEVKAKMNLPSDKDSFTVTFKAQDRADEFKKIQLVFRVVAYPSLSLESAYGPLDRFSSDLGVAATDGLNFDVRIADGTGSASCSKASGDSVGVHVVSLSNPTHAVISENGISVSEKESGSGYKICTVNVVPNENAAGDAEVELQVKSSTSVGIIASQANLTVPLTFWRQPELRCPERVSLPVGESLNNLQCDVHFVDGSAPADRSAESVSVAGGCGLSWASNALSGTMGTAVCTATVSASDVVNKFGAQVNPSSKSVQLIPRRFGTNGLVRTVARNSITGDLVLGGDFIAVDPIPAPGMTVVSTTDAQRASQCNLTEGFNGTVRKVVYDSSHDSFLVGGDFTRYRGLAANRIMRLYCSGEPAAWFLNKGFDGPVFDILITDDGSVVVGGAFDQYGDTVSKGVVRLSPNGVVKTAYSHVERASSEDGIFALAEANTTPPSVWIGGRFPSYNADSSFKNLARINLDTGVNELSSSAGFSAPVLALAAATDGVYVGGEFMSPGKRLLRLENNGDLKSGFSAGSLFEDTPVNSLFVSGSGLFAGALAQVVKLDAVTGNADSNFGTSGVVGLAHSDSDTEPVAHVVVSDGTSLYVGGRFTGVGSDGRRNFVKLNASSGVVDGTFNTSIGVNDAVRSLVLFSSDSQLSLVGEFSALGGTAAGRLAAFSSQGVFNSNLNGSLGSGFNGAVRALQWSGNDLYVGGAFTEVNSDSSRPYLVRLANPLAANGTASVVDSGFDTNTAGTLNGEVRALALAPDGSGKLFVGGAFSQYRGSAHKALMRLDSTGNPDTSFDVGVGFPPPLSGVPQAVVNTVALTPVDENSEYSIFAGGVFSKYRNNPAVNIVKVKDTGSWDSVFASSSSLNGPVLTTALSGTTLFVGGEFSDFNGTASNLVALNATNASLVASQNLAGTVRALAVDNSELWAGGSFFNEQASVARFNSSLELLGSTPASGKVLLGPHTPAGFHSSGLLNSVVAGIHALLPVTETVNGTPTLRLFVSGFFSLFHELSGNNTVRMEASGDEALANPDSP